MYKITFTFEDEISLFQIPVQTIPKVGDTICFSTDRIDWDDRMQVDVREKMNHIRKDIGNEFRVVKVKHWIAGLIEESNTVEVMCVAGNSQTKGADLI